MPSDFDYHSNKKTDKVYVSKRFNNRNVLTDEEIKTRKITKVFDIKDFYLFEYLKEYKSVVLRKTDSERQEVILHVLEEDKVVTGISIQRFIVKSGKPTAESFFFHQEEFKKMLEFLRSIKFIDFADPSHFKVNDEDVLNKFQDLSALAIKFSDLSKVELRELCENESLKGKDFVNLAYRKEGLKIFKQWIDDDMDDEKRWQKFFHEHDWIFGYGLDYRFMTIFDREMSVGDGGTEDQNKPSVDFLNEYNDFTVLVELKTPKTQLFDVNKKAKNRAGCWKLSTTFIDAYSQVLEQKAEWTIKGNNENNKSKDGIKKLKKRTRDPKMILVIGNKQKQISGIENLTEQELKMDTFELFRRDSRNIEIITYDELYERADFIVNHKF